jgi:hypothetical protein
MAEMAEAAEAAEVAQMVEMADPLNGLLTPVFLTRGGHRLLS